ncbi:alpha/beta fold hydrolase [Paraliomyxa miuraensis]|uniref:alpha/beta fold hydrolase n=1 Tax=Paraliomyxa miuraensis TaxID=376150 RepID=UPI0022565431|nr:alpha/beta hydrolase [Paraliomyxa miuraensis]MCX4240730.1 alpha/beta hydrolase [Paraliomyxa miuraensis]
MSPSTNETAAPEEIEIVTPALRLAARAWGPADGIPTLALHGWLDNAASFDGLAPRLPGLRLVCLDLPGHGLSEHLPAGGSYAFIDMVGHVHGALTALGWERFCLLGHSLGAAIASVLAGAMPGRVQRMALIEGLGPLSEEPKHAAERLTKALRDEARKRGRMTTIHRTREDAVQRLRAAMTRIDHESARTLVSRGLREVEGGFTWRSDPRLRLPSRVRLTEDQVLVLLRAIECPTLLVRCGDGYPFAPTAASARVAALRDATMVEVPGGHHVHLDDPEPVAAAVAAHLGALEPRDPEGAARVG